jgi:beta-galactosidase
VNWREHNVPKQPGELRIDALSAVARGADGVCFFQFRQSRFGAERLHSSVVPLAGEHTRVFREVAGLGSDLRALCQLAGTPSTANIAVLFDWDSWWAAESPDTPSNRLKVLDQLQAYYAPLHRSGLAVEVVHPSANTGQVQPGPGAEPVPPHPGAQRCADGVRPGRRTPGGGTLQRSGGP